MFAPRVESTFVYLFSPNSGPSGTIVQLTGQLDFPGDSYEIWIDLDNYGVRDPGELLATGSAAETSIYVTATFVIPSCPTGNYSVVLTDLVEGGGSYAQYFFVEPGPLAGFSYSPSSPAAGENVSFNATSSYGTIIDYLWEVRDSITSVLLMSYSSMSPYFMMPFSSAGTYDVTLTVTDSAYFSDSITHQIIVVNLGTNITRSVTSFTFNTTSVPLNEYTHVTMEISPPPPEGYSYENLYFNMRRPDNSEYAFGPYSTDPGSGILELDYADWIPGPHAAQLFSDSWQTIDGDNYSPFYSSWNSFTVLDEYTLTISVSGNGYALPYEGIMSLDEGTEVEVTAVPDTNWSLSHWLLDSVNVGSANPYTVTMNDDHIITAVLVEIPQDTTPPGAPTVSSSTHPDQNVWYSSNDASFTWTIPADPSGIAGYSVGISPYSFAVPDEIIDTTENSFSFTDVEDGEWYFHVRAVDNADNWGSTANYRIRIDTTAPDAPVPDDGVSGWSTDNTPTFDWDAPSDHGGSGVLNYQWRIDDGEWDYGTSWTIIIPAQSDGSHTFYVRAVDLVGNWGSIGSHDFYIDTTPPTGSIVINGGAATTDSVSVMLTLSASDPQSDVSDMQFRNDDGSWTGWEPYSTSKSWTLFSGDGPKTVYVHFRNNAGSYSTYSDEINLETPSEVEYYDLTVSVEGSGYALPYEGIMSYEEGTLVEVTAVADSNWTLSHWLLDLVNVGSANPYNVTMNDNHTLTAVFTEIEVVDYYLTIDVVGMGSSDPEPGDYLVEEGYVVEVEAVPTNSSWGFDHWLLDGVDVGSSNPYSFTMDDDHDLTAVFTETSTQYYDLTVTVEGQGTMNPSTGTHTYENGTAVIITNTPASGWEFSHYVFDGENIGTGPLIWGLVMTQDHTITAVFKATVVDHDLVVAVEGLGSTDPDLGDYLAEEGSVVEVEAVATDSSWVFDHWLLDDVNVGSSNPYTLTVDSDHTLTAVFVEVTEPEYTLSTSVVGSGTIDPEPGQYASDPDTIVDLTAIPDNGYLLDYWLLDGVNVGDSNPYSLTMDDDHVLTAVFKQDTGGISEYEVTITVAGSGSTDPEPGHYIADAGDSVTVVSVPDSGWKLDHWELDGANVGSGNSYTVSMNRVHSLKAVFIEDGGGVEGPYVLSVQVEGQGTTDPETGDYEVDDGYQVEVIGYADDGWVLDHWLLDGNNVGSDDSYSFVMTSDHVLTAVFRQSDVNPPVIGNHFVNPEEPSKDSDVTIRFELTDESSVSSASLVYSVDGADWEVVDMVLSGDSWVVSVPKQSEGSFVEYYVACYDAFDNYAESDSFSYEIKAAGLELGTIAAVAVGATVATAGGTVAVLKLTGRSVLHLGRKVGIEQVGRKGLRTKTEDSSDKNKRKKKEKKKRAKLKWTFNSPQSIRAGGVAYAYGKVSNVGEGKAENVQIIVKGPDVLKFDSPIKLGDIEKDGFKDVKIKLECREAVAERKDTVMYSLESKSGQPETLVRSISFRYMKVGLVSDSQNLEYLKREGSAIKSDGVSGWLKANKFDFGVVSDLGNANALGDFDVLLVSSQYALSGVGVANLRQFVKGGGGLVALDGVGVVDADAYLAGKTDVDGAKRVFDLFGYSKAGVAKIEKGLKGLRIVENMHPVSKLQKKGAILKLAMQTGFAFIDSVAKGRVLADQRVAVAGRSGFVAVAAVIAGVFGGGRVVHFNFDAEKTLAQISLMIEQALIWTAKIE